MTVAPTTTETVYELIGTNLGPFATVWPYQVHTDVKVYLDLGDGPQLLTEETDYTLSPTNPTLTNGGEVTLDAALLGGGAWATDLFPAGDADANTPTVILARDTPDGQPSSFGEMGGFSPEQWEAALDYQSRQIQELDTKWARTVHDQVGEGGWNVPDEIARAGHVVGFDAGGHWTLYPGEPIVGSGYYVVTFGLGGTAQPAGGEPFEDHPIPFPLQAPANFVGAIFWGMRTPPAADFTILFADQAGNPKGQIVLHPDGTAAASSPGAAVVNFAAGDVLRPTCQAGVDTALVGPSVTIVFKIVTP